MSQIITNVMISVVNFTRNKDNLIFMKKTLLTACFIFTAAIGIVAVNGESLPVRKGKSVEISFEYVRKPGGGSNQFAVWIENEKEEVVKTLFVTAFTSKGRARGNQPARRGYTFRPACMPTWVKNSKVAEMSDEEVDVFTGATPQSGRQIFSWDFTDTHGHKVPKGNYKVCVEATLKDAYRMMFSGMVSTEGKAGEIPVNVIETQADEAYVGMIQSVNITVK